MRIAVTGATGFVGGAIIRRLTAHGHDVLALGRSAVGPEGLNYSQWDLAVGGPPPAAVADCEAVVHAAARVASWGSEQLFESVTVTGSARLMDAIDPAARLVVIGSSSVYVPDGRSGTYRERDAPVDPGRYLGPYPRSKAAQERLVTARRPDAIILRPRAVWGPGDRTLLPRVERRIRAGVLLLPDGGRHRMSTTHIETLADAVDAALARPDIHGPVNVADATQRSPEELLRAVFAARHVPLRVVGIPWRVAIAAAVVVEAAYRLARSRWEPPITRYAVGSLGAPMILDLGRLHRDLGIAPDVDLGIRAIELAEARGG